MSCYVTGLVPNQYLAQIHFQNMTPVEQNPFTYSNLTNDHLILQVADFSEINKRVGHNKAMQEGFFSHLYRRKSGFKGKISKINKCGGPNKVVQVFFPKKIIRFAAQLLGRSEQFAGLLNIVGIMIKKILRFEQGKFLAR